jgi:hypothetical protein
MGYWVWQTARPDWQTVLFTTLTLSQMGQAMAIRRAVPTVKVRRDGCRSWSGF